MNPTTIQVFEVYSNFEAVKSSWCISVKLEMISVEGGAAPNSPTSDSSDEEPEEFNEQEADQFQVIDNINTLNSHDERILTTFSRETSLIAKFPVIL